MAILQALEDCAPSCLRGPGVGAAGLVCRIGPRCCDGSYQEHAGHHGATCYLAAADDPAQHSAAHQPGTPQHPAHDGTATAPTSGVGAR